MAARATEVMIPMMTSTMAAVVVLETATAVVDTAAAVMEVTTDQPTVVSAAGTVSTLGSSSRGPATT